MECFAVLTERFFLTGNSTDAEILYVFPRTEDYLWGKRFRQNRVNPYVSPPKSSFFNGQWTIDNGQLLSAVSKVGHSEPALAGVGIRSLRVHFFDGCSKNGYGLPRRCAPRNDVLFI